MPISPTPTTVEAFAFACADLTNDQIYNLFENQISQELRDKIYNEYSGDDMNEPCRAAMDALGMKYSIQSLKDY